MIAFLRNLLRAKRQNNYLELRRLGGIAARFRDIPERVDRRAVLGDEQGRLYRFLGYENADGETWMVFEQTTLLLVRGHG